MKVRVCKALLACLGFAGALLAQSSNGSMGGIVQDPSGALIPGVTITIANTGTGVANTTVSNETGAYTFPSVAPGTYRASAALPGFRTSVFNDVGVGTSAQVRLDFKMQLGEAVGNTVEVSVAAQQLLSESSATIGTVLPQSTVRALPLVGGDVLSLINVMPGVVGESFAGVAGINVNTTRDGLPVADQRFNNGVFGTTMINPDLVGEVRIILAPVDVEMGRGNGQVQILTRSGTNRYTGAAVWNVRNSALNANTWSNNKTLDPKTGAWKPTVPNWHNNHQYTVSLGGPVFRNRTFFFGLWDQQINYQRILQSGIVLTDTARQGIFRYWEGYNPGGSETVLGGTATTAKVAAVNALGNPIAPQFAPGSTTAPYTGRLLCFSVFGTRKFDGSAFTQGDCGGGTALFPAAAATSWDTLRPVADSTGYVRKLLGIMPPANFFADDTNGTDGLNNARHRWILHRQGNQGAFVTTGADTFTNRKQFNLKIDHNFSGNHKLSVSWSKEGNGTDSDVPLWPGGLAYRTIRDPQVLTLTFTSTLSGNLVNEARLGYRYSNTDIVAPWQIDATREEALSWTIPGQASPSYAKGKNYYSLIGPGGGGVGVANSAQYLFNSSLTGGVFNTNPGQFNGNKNSTSDIVDTLSWTHGRHTYKFGVEMRMTSANGFNNIPLFPFERITGGAGNFPSPLNTAATALPGLLAAARTSSSNMLYLLAGSVSEAQMLYWIDHEKDIAESAWEDTQTKESEGGKRYRHNRNSEWSTFVKDDWKISKNLTLNVGLRYDYYGSPYVRGLTSAPIGLGDGLFGEFQGPNPFQRWLTPGTMYLSGYGPNAPLSSALKCVAPTCDPAKLTAVRFIGPETSNPDKKVVPADYNNFGPAFGFAWTLPWFGEGKTTVRGGYQITYGGNFGGTGIAAGGAGNTLDTVMGAGAQTTAQLSLYNEYASQYYDLTRVAEFTPVRPTAQPTPGATLQPYSHAGTYYAYDARYVTPYTQNFTLSVTRNVRRNVTVDVRYVGTASRKQRGTIQLNLANVYHNPELFAALEAARRGENPALLDQMMAGLNLNSGVAGYGAVGSTVNGVVQTGAMHLRRNATFSTSLANGNFSAVAASLATNNGTIAAEAAGGPLALPAGFTDTVSGRLLRNGCDRLAAGQTTVGVSISTPLRCFPENYIVANPQLINAGAFYNTNDLFSNYHSLQSQVTLRPTHGISYQATYTWSKNLGIEGNTLGTYYTDPTNRRADYTYAGSHRSHDFRGNGTFELPIGPNKLLFGNTSGWLARTLERWQASMIFTMSSGSRASVSAAAGTGLYANAVPDVVGPLASLDGTVRWNGTPTSASSHGGTYFGNPSPYVRVPDPQCAAVVSSDPGFNLNSNCTLGALAIRNSDGSAGPIVLQNPSPGTRGTLGRNVLEVPGTYRFDASLSKSFRIDESKSLQIRLDATNVLNHADPGNPTLTLNDSFGDIASKGGQVRNFQGQLRLSF